jgi:hypothetical protein
MLTLIRDQRQLLQNDSLVLAPDTNTAVATARDSPSRAGPC